jgi:atypical dual specificity phosphatase
MAGRSWSRRSHPFLRPAGRPGLSSILEDRLYVGEYPTPDDVPWLKESLTLGALVSLQDDADLASKGVELSALEEACANAGVALWHFPVADGDPHELTDSLPAILERLHDLLERGTTVYLHCNAGFNRAPTVAIAYLHLHGGLGLAEACAFVKKRRACAPYMSVLEPYFARRQR